MPTKKTTQTKTTKKTTSNTSTSRPSSMPFDVARVSKALQGNKKPLIALVIVLIAVGLYFGKGLFVVALVNGQPVTRYEVIKELESQAGQSTTDAIISEILVKQKASEQGITISQEQIDERIKEIEADLATTGQSLDELLELQGLTRDAVEDQIRLQLMLRELLADKIEVSVEEVEAAVEQQAEVKPEGMSDEEFAAQIQAGLEEQQFAFEAQSYIQGLQSEANTTYWHQY